MKTKSGVLSSVAIGALLGSASAFAQQPYESTTCRAGTVSILAQVDKSIVWALDHRGVSMSANPEIDGFTQRCIGTVSNIEGRISANGYCRNVDPRTGDMILVDWTASDKPGHGTWSYRLGTGKWKGVSGGGTYEPVGPTKPVEPGTYQNCVRVNGTYKLPG